MKKIKNSLILVSVILMFAGGMFLTSCDKTELVEPNEKEGLEKSVEGFEKRQQKVENFDLRSISKEEDMLVFKNMEEFNTVLFKLNDMETQERKNWENEKEFSSMFTKYCEFEKQSAAINDRVEQEDLWKKENSKLVSSFDKVVDSNNEINTFDFYYAVLLNNDGKVKVGNTIYTFGKDELIIEDGKLGRKTISMNDYYNVNNNEKYKEIEILKGLGYVVWSDDVEEYFYFQFGGKYKLTAEIKYYSSKRVKANAHNYKKKWGRYKKTELKYTNGFMLTWKRSSGSTFEFYKATYSFPGWYFSGYAGSIKEITFWGNELVGDDAINNNYFRIEKIF